MSVFSRSFSNIRAADLDEAVSREYGGGRFWPDALLSLNPRYETGPTVDALVHSGDLDPATAQIFSIWGNADQVSQASGAGCTPSAPSGQIGLIG